MTWHWASKKTLSVTSSTSWCGSTPLHAAMSRTRSAKSGCCSCTPETFTARVRRGSSASQGCSSVQLRRSTSAPMSRIRPLRSAVWMNWSGGISFPSHCQRARASNCTTSSCSVDTTGW